MLAGLIEELAARGISITADELRDALWLLRVLPASAQQLGPATTKAETRGSESTTSSVVRGETGRAEDVSTTRAPLVAKTKQDVAADVFAPARATTSAVSRSGVPFRAPAAAALPGAMEIGRALRPLRRRVRTHRLTYLDEEATARRILEERIWMPVLRPASISWLEVALVVDGAASMALWHRTIADFDVLLRQGLFRDVRRWTLETEMPEGEPRLYAGATRSGPAHDPRELIDPTGHRLILMVTDGVAAAWRDGRVSRLLGAWGKRSPTAIIDVLPRHLWIGTALGDGVPVRLSADRPSTSNDTFTMTFSSSRRRERHRPKRQVPFPIVELAAESIGDLAKVIAGKPGAQVSGVMLAAEGVAASGPTFAADRSGLDRVERFEAIASPTAQKLAQLLAATPLSLPVMRLVREVMLPDATNAHIAEVFLGGLIEEIAIPGSRSAPDDVRYDFRDGVRDELLRRLPVDQSIAVLTGVSRYVGSRLGQSIDFPALLADPSRSSTEWMASSHAQRFATIAASVLLPLGGKYTELAKRLVERDSPRVAIDVPAARSSLLSEGEALELARVFHALLGERRPQMVLATLLPLDAGALPEIGPVGEDRGPLAPGGPERPFQNWLVRCDAMQLVTLLSVISEHPLAAVARERLRPIARLGILENGAWIFVVGSDGMNISEAQQEAAAQLGAELAKAGFSLVTLGTQGIAHIVARSFFRVLERCGYETGLHRMLNVVPEGERADFEWGRTIHPQLREHILNSTVRRADAIVVFGDSGLTSTVLALKGGRPIRQIRDDRVGVRMRDEVTALCEDLGMNDPIVAPYPELCAIAELALDARDLGRYNEHLRDLQTRLPTILANDTDDGPRVGALIGDSRRATWRLVGHHFYAPLWREGSHDAVRAARQHWMRGLPSSLRAEQRSVRLFWETRTLSLALELVGAAHLLDDDGGRRAIAAACYCLDAEFEAEPRADAEGACKTRLKSLLLRDACFSRAQALAWKAREIETLGGRLERLVQAESRFELIRAMTALVAEIEVEGEGAGLEEIEIWFESGRPRDRILALALLSGSPQPKAATIVLKALRHSASPFERAIALRAAERLSSHVMEEDRPRLRDAIEAERSRRDRLDLTDFAERALPRALVHETCDIGIVVTSEDAFRVLFELIRDRHTTVQDGDRTDYVFEVPHVRKDPSSRCVVTMTGEMGATNTTLAVEDLIEAYSPELIVTLGLVAGIHEDVRIGDIIVVNEIVDYQDDVGRFRSTPTSAGSYSSVSPLEFVRSPTSAMWRKAASERHGALLSIEPRLASNVVARDPAVREGAVASRLTAKLSRDFATRIKRYDRACLAIDVDTAATVIAARPRSRQANMLVLRAVSGLAGTDEHEVLRALAVENMTSFLWALLEAGELPRRRPAVNELETLEEAVLRVLREHAGDDAEITATWSEIRRWIGPKPAGDVHAAAIHLNDGGHFRTAYFEGGPSGICSVALR